MRINADHVKQADKQLSQCGFIRQCHRQRDMARLLPGCDNLLRIDRPDQFERLHLERFGDALKPVSIQSALTALQLSNHVDGRADPLRELGLGEAGSRPKFSNIIPNHASTVPNKGTPF